MSQIRFNITLFILLFLYYNFTAFERHKVTFTAFCRLGKIIGHKQIFSIQFSSRKINNLWMLGKHKHFAYTTSNLVLKYWNYLFRNRVWNTASREWHFVQEIKEDQGKKAVSCGLPPFQLCFKALTQHQESEAVQTFKKHYTNILPNWLHTEQVQWLPWTWIHLWNCQLQLSSKDAGQ